MTLFILNSTLILQSKQDPSLALDLTRSVAEFLHITFLPYSVISALTQSRIWCWHFWTMLLLVSVCFLNKVYVTLLAKQL